SRLSENSGIKEERHLVLLSSQEDTRQWFRGSLEVGNRLAAFGPLYAADPAMQFCLQAARRQLGEWEAARQWYTRFIEQHMEGPWREAAAAELWLQDRRGPAPKPVAFCRQTSFRPFLDGEFDDHCWQGQSPMMLR